ncbi:MAG: 50S ribosomal protein L6 [Candidatus Raymondbacteria bacterium RifOxyA12_full_50_37]|uniref:Large ribosomal subunit protein uL6 n=1 Tax=Candidatus Raymondbacteria bacterium RIFOXYD12_FULL_49_13 TaxID=1817890 RepID=A0A1F7FD50_UNCRA|nr:ribosomal protein L6 [uncultured bacterium]OGJ88092.1 MAG: 50S ribosomal protein L6 [Candidatus Raymondbacteria bacterium RifOxyA12_full_50_37]OGJ94069.1 MAG: 50S ribosomal protein L6 [Candidatus Raymondbacteria bacterium RIFOXYA2_FULL_49_16]OGJ96824.1 MAG: 50S ribosomal protein L6 [Candidatus Raymondbacteria bacterium RifOxyC12_full_50_8]OGJ96894.1 MAG: 50S ribosomal protein L6 [Candidatus Raymondbacteria bacterium RIFOXYC2_FULL_50_21]OGK04620.1 MAG: 50S ribosomal protein L6 [Candidatus Ra
MSRIGKLPISIPDKVKVNLTGCTLSVQGPKGALSQEINPLVSVEISGNTVVIKRSSDEKTVRALHGLYRALVQNMVVGVTQGYEKALEVIGVGYKAIMKGRDVEVSVGFSSPRLFKCPENVKVACEGTNKIRISGCDKKLVGQVAANIRKIRPPEPYKGKGIKYADEYIKRKVGKATA